MLNNNILTMTNNQNNVDIIKFSAVIAIEHKVSLLGQKLFNILWHNAYYNMTTQPKHTITVKKLLEYIPSAKNVGHLRKTLKKMCIPVEYNLFSKDKADWGFFALLPEAEIKDGTGVCEYAFTSKMIEMMAHSEKMYAKISLLIQQRYQGTKYGWFLYELCFDYKNTPGGGRTQKMSINKLKQYLGIEQSKYPTFKRLNYEVLKPAMRDLNKYSDLLVTMKTYKEGKQIMRVQFFMQDKSKETTIVPINNKSDNKEQLRILQRIGVSDKAITKIITRYSSEQISRALVIYKEKEEGKGVNHPTAFIESALKDGWNPKLTPEAPASKETKANDLALENVEIKKEQELYRGMTDNEKFNHMLKTSEALKKVYSKLTPENQEKVKQYAYETVFSSFEEFKPCCSPVFEKAKELKNK